MFVRTDRLLLRPGWPEDAQALHAAIGDEAVVRNLALAPWPYTLQHARDFLAREGDQRLPECLIFMRTQGTPRLIGGIGLHRDADEQIELGYWVARAHWGLGYATEAGHALLTAARHTLRLGPIVAGHFVDNRASGRVLRKLGFHPTGRTAQRHSLGRGAVVPCALYARDEDSPCDADMRCLEHA